ncbi:vesicle-associated membrane protein-associated protein B-like [Condylostylus longicornis]|uniref:vesicle-associated membrane protein-associated protein B-like n=1 Tax=Condylostylus longicornis TaxID=2530218 RepID=UPI00244DF340|nr:vesicle-associated membrane protein-associated protein B-like [Condylostylus longicornis]
MERKEQLLIIDPPSELKFRGPFIRPVVTVMKLTNPTDNTILFKIKTTAPRKYCVRPNFGAVKPQSQTEVEICLQASFIFDPSEKNKHKFMVQSFVVPDGAVDPLKLWKEVKPEQLMDTKLRCVFELPPEWPAGETVAQKEEVNAEAEIKTISDDKVKDYRDEYVKATLEIRQLREDESQLRQENLKLKEQLLKNATADVMQKKQQTSPSSVPYQNAYSPPQLGQQPVPVMYIAIAVIMAIFGLLLGKYML